jgi:arylsulfatase A-like enzyme
VSDGAVSLPRAPAGARSVVWVTLDSCRYDSFVAACTPTLTAALGPVQRRHAFASWTAPSHYNLLLGLLPHANAPGVLGSLVYRDEFQRHEQRFGFPLLRAEQSLEGFYLPNFLRSQGYFTGALVSMPALHPRTPVNRGFDHYEQMPRPNDMRAMLPRLRFPAGQPSFWLLNIGETHYPYALPGEDPSVWPRLRGVGGVLRELAAGGDPARPPEFDADVLAGFHARQIRAVEYLDGVFAELFALVPEDTWVTVTADHGELFGEDGYFGHGPIQHPKVFEVPFLEGRVRPPGVPADAPRA